MINYYHTDCMNFMSNVPDKYYDIGIVDPNWGRGEDGGKKGRSKIVQKNGRVDYLPLDNHKKKDWDNKPADKKYFDELLRVTKHQIIWGVNYYGYSFGSGRIIWDKVNDGSDQSDCEIAFNSLTERVDLVRYMWRGMMQGKSLKHGSVQQGNKKLNEKRIHPTQKPSLLYVWLLQKFVPKGWKILDTHLGSGSQGIACERLGYSLDACEKDSDIYNAANDWLKSVQKAKIDPPELFKTG